MFPGSNGLPNPATIQTFVTGASNSVDLETGPGGDLFYVDHEGGAIHRVTVESTTAPTARITGVPTAGATPLKVDFDGTGSTDPNPGTLSYAWDLDGNGTFGDFDLADAVLDVCQPGTRDGRAAGDRLVQRAQRGHHDPDLAGRRGAHRDDRLAGELPDLGGRGHDRVQRPRHGLEGATPSRPAG